MRKKILKLLVCIVLSILILPWLVFPIINNVFTVLVTILYVI